jgi:FkbM family methyltransferase
MRISTNPLSALALLAGRSPERLAAFRLGQMVVSARRADLCSISEIALDHEYGFITRRPFPGPGALVLDLGANIGCFAAWVLSHCPDAEVHSVEPSPDTFRLLTANRQRYPALRWFTHPLAISHVSGWVTFDNAGPSTGRRVSAGGRGVAVQGQRFQEFVRRVSGGRRVFLCKMDIEGAEVPIFSEALDVLDRIDHFIVEVHGPAASADLVRTKLASSFPHVEAVAGRRSSKPVLHAWRHEAGTAGADAAGGDRDARRATA